MSDDKDQSAVKLPTTGMYSHKSYQCETCGTTKSIGTNHWGKIYPWCNRCNTITVWRCLEPVPDGYGVPEEWKITTLG